MRFTTFEAYTKFAWYPVRLRELRGGRYEWAWLERVLRMPAGGYLRRGISASPIEVGRHAEDVASGKLVVRPER